MLCYIIGVVKIGIKTRLRFSWLLGRIKELFYPKEMYSHDKMYEVFNQYFNVLSLIMIPRMRGGINSFQIKGIRPIGVN